MTKKKTDNWEKKDIKAAKGTTYVAIVIDKSSSMHGVKEQAVAGYNDTVEDMWELAKENDIKVSLVTFDTHVYEHLWNVPAEELTKSNFDSFKPTGCTALWDGLGYTVDKLMETQLNDDDAMLIIVISDGGENSSKNVDPVKLKSRIEETQGSGQWTFTYMGCSMSMLREISQQTSIPMSNMAAWDNVDYESTGRAMAQNKGKFGSYMRSRKMNSKKSLSKGFHSEVEGQAADYTSDEGHGVNVEIRLRDCNDFIDLSKNSQTVGKTEPPSANNWTRCATSSDCSNSAGNASYTTTNTTSENIVVEGGEDVFGGNSQVDFKAYKFSNIC